MVKSVTNTDIATDQGTFPYVDVNQVSEGMEVYVKVIRY